MARRLVIAIDCDDVLVHTKAFFIGAYNKKYGTNVTFDEAHRITEELWGAPTDTVLERLDAFLESAEYKALGINPDEVTILRRLSEQHELHLVTARKEVERELTQSVLERDAPGVFTSVNLVGWQGSKGEVCRRIGADVLIDDSARHLHDALAHGLPKSGALLFGRYPWNADDSAHEDLTHCHSWEDVERTITALAQKGVSAE